MVASMGPDDPALSAGTNESALQPPPWQGLQGLRRRSRPGLAGLPCAIGSVCGSQAKPVLPSAVMAFWLLVIDEYD